VTASEKLLHVDIPVKLSDVKMVFSIGALAFEGGLPAAIFHLQLIENDITDWNAKSEVIAVFHTNAGHVTLHDIAYDATGTSRRAIPTRTLSAISRNAGCRLSSAARPRKPTAGGTQICFLG
jgi:hypothetical protein